MLYVRVDTNRRYLLAVTIGMGGIGLAATAIPFLKSMEPSEAAKAAGAPVEVDFSGLGPGKLMTVEFRGKPIWILHRSEQMLASLNNHDNLLADPGSANAQQPDYAKNPARAIRQPFFIVTGICTHLGCVPTFRPESSAPDLGAEWPGGFYCPCHGSKFDLAGRVFRNVPAPLNLEVPRYQFLSDARVRIGADVKGV
jgi:ubiquinol-cytochrome c reductase iron-sulfur subunit